MKINLIVFIFVFLMMGCKNSSKPFPSLFSWNEEIPEPDQIMMKIMDTSVSQIQSKYDIHPCGMGMSGKFRHVSIEFQVFRKLEKSEARSMLVDCVNIFLSNINKNEYISPYLETSPFTEKNVGVTFYISNEDSEKLFHPDICIACWYGKAVYFQTNDPESKYGYKETTEETHEEAIELVKQYRASQVAHKNG